MLLILENKKKIDNRIMHEEISLLCLMCYASLEFCTENSSIFDCAENSGIVVMIAEYVFRIFRCYDPSHVNFLC